MDADLTENPFFDPLFSQQKPKSQAFVLFGATGDLAHKKLFPSLFALFTEGMLPEHLPIIAIGRRDYTHESFRNELTNSITSFARKKPVDEKAVEQFLAHVFYQKLDFDSDADYQNLKKNLDAFDLKSGTGGHRVFYLSVQPSFFAPIAGKLKQHGLIYPPTDLRKSILIIEKPFGHDLASAIALQQDLTQHLSEEQIYRIDHYLGKETVQNLFAFRFGNSIFENLWNSRYVDHIQITVAEDIGIEKRAAFYEKAGCLRDIIQNHAMQLLALVTMEAPVSLTPKSLQDEKVKLLEAIAPLDSRSIGTDIVRGQYRRGWVNEKEAASYLEEAGVDPKSNIDTFIAAKLSIDNWRWAGVPIYIRAGKRLARRYTQIRVIFKPAPPVLLSHRMQTSLYNGICFQIQPDEGIWVKLYSKAPGSTTLYPVTMDFRYRSFFGSMTPDAYERLLLDALCSDKTLFFRVDEALASWKIFDGILKPWSTQQLKENELYSAGSWGPLGAEELIRRDGRYWRN